VAAVTVVFRYYVYTTEWVWSQLDPGASGKLVSIWDITNVSATSLAGDRLKMLKALPPPPAFPVHRERKKSWVAGWQW